MNFLYLFSLALHLSFSLNVLFFQERYFSQKVMFLFIYFCQFRIESLN